MKIEIIIDQAYSTFVKEKLNIEYWEKNYEIVILNVRNLFFRDLNIHNTTSEFHIEFENKKEFKEYIKTSSSDITLLLLRYPTSELINFLTKNKRLTYILLMNYLPSTILKQRFKRLLIKINTNLSIFGVKKLFHKLLIKNKIKKEKINGIVLFGGEDGINQFKHLIGKSTKIIQSYSTDAELLKNNSKINNIYNSKEKIAIFIDQAFPDHPDIIELGLILNKNIYYQRLNNFFAYLENNYGFKVLIMGHPRYKYMSNPFNKREIIYGKTMEYSRISDLIVTFSSTAISFGIMLKKNIVLLLKNLTILNLNLTV